MLVCVPLVGASSQFVASMEMDHAKKIKSTPGLLVEVMFITVLPYERYPGVLQVYGISVIILSP